MAGCRKGDCQGKEFFIDSKEPVDVNLVDIEQGVTYDVGEECEEYVQGDECPLLVVRKVCFTPRKFEGEEQRRNNTFSALVLLGVSYVDL